jgi:hypothetical protein
MGGLVTSSGANMKNYQMTADDTFNALKKSSYEVLYNEWIGHNIDIGGSYYNDLNTIIKKHGWSSYEFWEEYDKRPDD